MNKPILLGEKGLSLSEAQSFSNIINQRVVTALSTLDRIGAYNETFGYGDKTVAITKNIHLKKDDITERLLKISEYRYAQAFLMEAIKEKAALLQIDETVDISDFKYEREGELNNLIEKLIATQREANNILREKPLSHKETLDYDKYKDYLYHESVASSIGKFINADGHLTSIRKLAEQKYDIQFTTVEDGKKIAIDVNPLYTPEELLEIHEHLALEHNKSEKRVNYYKANYENYVSSFHIDQKTRYAEKMQEWSKLKKEVENLQAESQQLKDAFENNKRKELIQLRSENSKLRVHIDDEKIQKIIDDLSR